MRADILQSRNSDQVRDYVLSKFNKFDSWTYSRNRRDRKCINYYLCASDQNKRIVEWVYSSTFKSTFPRGRANEVLAEIDRKAAGPVMIPSNEWVDRQENRVVDAQELLDQLILWKDTGEYQCGETFFLELQARVAKFDASLVNPREF